MRIVQLLGLRQTTILFTAPHGAIEIWLL